MNTWFSLLLWLSSRRASLGIAAAALLGIASVHTHADQRATSAASSRVSDESLADLNLSTPEGMSPARERLHTMSQRPL